ncbi:MAG: trypsin-like serine protease [Zetaproteobacteria bacterium]|nr:trypsin-like serine protease [Zetaproteobacteria bacterium]
MRVLFARHRLLIALCGISYLYSSLLIAQDRQREPRRSLSQTITNGIIMVIWGYTLYEVSQSEKAYQLIGKGSKFTPYSPQELPWIRDGFTGMTIQAQPDHASYAHTVPLQQPNNTPTEADSELLLYLDKGYHKATQEEKRRYDAYNVQPKNIRLDPCKPQIETNSSASPADRAELQPWSRSGRLHCKIFTRYEDGDQNVCSGSLIGEDLLLTARHCTENSCAHGKATRITVSCGYGAFTPPSGKGDQTVFVEQSYSPYGRAMISDCIYNRAYSQDMYCKGGQERGWRPEFDIQICKLDRKLGKVLGWNAVTTAPLQHIHVRGYPGYHPTLAAAIPLSYHKQLVHDLHGKTIQLYKEVHEVREARSWHGESGGAWYEEVGNTKHNQTYQRVGAVTSYGRNSKEGCMLGGIRLPKQLLEQAFVPQNQTQGSDYCHVVRYTHDHQDLFNGDHDALSGVGTALDARPHQAIASIAEGEDVSLSLTLFNVGTLPTTLRLDWHTSVDNKGVKYGGYLGSTTFIIDAGKVQRIYDKHPISPMGTRFVFASWHHLYPGCAPLAAKLDPNWAYVGAVTSKHNVTR